MDQIFENLVAALQDNEQPVELDEARMDPNIQRVLNELKQAKAALLVVVVAIRHYVKQNQRMIADLQRDVEKLSKQNKKESDLQLKAINDWHTEWRQLEADRLRKAYHARVAAGPARPR